MTVETEMMNEENGRLRRHIKTLEAELKKQEAAQAQAATVKDSLTVQAAVEPVAYLAWRDGSPCYEGEDAVCEDAVWPVDDDDDRTSMAVYLASPPEHTAVMQQALDALCLPCSRWNKTQTEIINAAIAALRKELE